MGFSRIHSAHTYFLKGKKVTVEVDTGKGLNNFSIVGLGDKAIEEARDRVGSALKNSGFESPKHSNIKTVVSLAPANIKKEGAYFDMAIAIGFLVAEDILDEPPYEYGFIGELGLNGDVRELSGVLPIVVALKKEGITTLFIPHENKDEACIVDGIIIYPVQTLSQALDHLRGKKLIEEYIGNPSESKQERIINDFGDIKEQHTAKRALQVAAAGRHNIAMYGPPGTGKTMLAKAFAEILPPLSKEESLDITSIHSIAGTLPDGGLLSTPPFRSPHHSASYVSLIGGGTNIRPGEVTLAHKGVLFLDEFPEFEKRVIESLRQPLEDGVVSIARAKGSVVYSSDFILITAMNPCPCGYKGSKVRDCTCRAHDIDRYRRKISGPILDRIDMWIYVGEIDFKKLSMEEERKNETSDIRKKIIGARKKMSERTKVCNVPNVENARISSKYLNRLAPLSPECEQLLQSSAEKLGLSARAYHRIIKVARTISDLDESEAITPNHILEALTYRPQFS